MILVTACLVVTRGSYIVRKMANLSDESEGNPGKSFGLKFIPNQSDLFRNLFPHESELIRVNPKKVFNPV